MDKIDYTIRIMKELRTMVKRKDYGYTRGINSAIQALQNQAEREKGCEYCNQPLRIEACHVTEAGFRVGQTEIAKFCPKCGKRLE